MFKLIDQFRCSRSGATAVEYALLAMCIVLAIVGAVAFLGTQLNTKYTEVTATFR
jgi:Flp pilus assembly pilin Flp